MSINYDHDHENEITLFAETNFRNQRRRFGIKTDDRRKHIYIIGKTGMGKTVLQENMVMSDIMAGHGVCYIDPHGDTAEKILGYIPSNRINDVVYFNPADLDYPVGFNILETVKDSQKHLVASGLMGVFKKIWPDVWSARMEYILLNCVLALLDYPGATLLGINRLLVDSEYRARVITKIRDPIVKTFWVAEFTTWSEKYQTEAIAPIQNKVGQFLSASIVRNIVSQVRSTIDVRDIMDSGKIFIVNLSKGRIGEENMRLLGGMIISRLQMAAMERVDLPEDDRRDFYLFVDEFQNFANESFASILSEARKYHLNLTVAHQYIEQLTEEVRAAVMGNAGTILTFRVGGMDAAFLEQEFTPTFTPEDLVNLPKYNIYLKLMVDGVATTPFSATTLPPMAVYTDNASKVIAVSRERYAVPRANIEEKVLRWSGMEAVVTLKGAESAIEEEKKQLGGYTPGSLQSKVLSEEEKGLPESEPVEYLKISPERLQALVKSPAQGKKDKPKYSHTCDRCGKVWDMPVQLDKSRPMFCADCMPIVREEKKTKSKIVKYGPGGEKGRSAGKEEKKEEKPNRPRIVGNLVIENKNLPVAAPVAQPAPKAEQSVRALSFLEELKKIKGRALEDFKPKAEKTDLPDRLKKIELKAEKHSDKGSSQKNSNSPVKHGYTGNKKFKHKSAEQNRLSPKPENEGLPDEPSRTLTVFKSKTINNAPKAVNNALNSSGTLRPGERVTF